MGFIDSMTLFSGLQDIIIVNYILVHFMSKIKTAVYAHLYGPKYSNKSRVAVWQV